MRVCHNPSPPPIVVVLGGGMNRDGTCGRATILRARRAVNLARANPSWTFILSGDGRVDTTSPVKTEAQCMAEILESNGIARSRFVLEDESRDTIGNAMLVTARYLQHETPRNLYVVTSPFHATRSQLLFRAVLGPSWTVQVITSAAGRGDALRRANEAGGIQWSQKFLSGITPGDLPALTARLLAERPYYACSKWLKFDGASGSGGTASGSAVA